MNFERVYDVARVTLRADNSLRYPPLLRGLAEFKHNFAIHRFAIQRFHGGSIAFWVTGMGNQWFKLDFFLSQQPRCGFCFLILW